MRVGILGIKSIPGVMGADRTVELVLQRLPTSHRYTVYVVREEHRVASSTSLGSHVRFVRIPTVPGKHLRASIFFLLSGLHAATLGRYDVAHVHNSDFGAFCLPLRLSLRTRIVGTFHGDPYARAKWNRFAKLFLRLSEWFFVRACHVLTSVTSVKRVRGRDVTYIPNGVDPWQQDPSRGAAALERLRLKPGRFVMFACGRLDPTKGLHHLLRAYADFPGDDQLVVVGDFSHDRPYSASIEAAADADPRVVLHKDLMPRDELLELVSRSRAFVFPSEVEGMAMMLLEAISSGATVICSDIPENLAVVGADYPLRFRAGDPGSLRDALSEVDRSDQDAAAIASGVREHVLRRFSWDDVARRYAQIYESG